MIPFRVEWRKTLRKAHSQALARFKNEFRSATRAGVDPSEDTLRSEQVWAPPASGVACDEGRLRAYLAQLAPLDPPPMRAQGIVDPARLVEVVAPATRAT